MDKLILYPEGKTGICRLYPSLRRDFRRLERMPVPVMLNARRKNALECFTVVDRLGEEYGYAICSVSSLYGYVMINYLAINPDKRGNGAGMETLELIARRYEHKQGLIVELTENPGEEAELHSRRRFYSRAGYRDTRSDYYVCGARTHLMVLPLRGNWDISEHAHFIIPEIYRSLMPEKMADAIIKISKVKSNE